MQRKHFAAKSFFAVVARAYSRLLCEFFSVANVNRFLSVNQITTISFGNCFEQSLG